MSFPVEVNRPVELNGDKVELIGVKVVQQLHKRAE